MSCFVYPVGVGQTVSRVHKQRTKETLDWQNLTRLAHNYYIKRAIYIYSLVIFYLHVHACTHHGKYLRYVGRG